PICRGSVQTIEVCPRTVLDCEPKCDGRDCGGSPAHEAAGINHPARRSSGRVVARSFGAAADGAGCRIPRTAKARRDSPRSWLHFTEPPSTTAISNTTAISKPAMRRPKIAGQKADTTPGRRHRGPPRSHISVHEKEQPQRNVLNRGRDVQ